MRITTQAPIASSDMWESITSTCSSFWRYYVNQMQYHWHHMTPIKYGCLLIFIGVVGFLLMKSNMKKC